MTAAEPHVNAFLDIRSFLISVASSIVGIR